MKKYFTIFLLSALLLACDDKVPGGGKQAAEITLTGNMCMTDDGRPVEYVPQGGTVYTWALGTGVWYIDAWKLASDGNGGFNGTPRYFPENETLDFFVLHGNFVQDPIAENETLFPENDGLIHSIAADQREGIASSDLLYAVRSGVAASPVNMEFYHMMSKVEITLRAGDGVSAADIDDIKVKLLNVAQDAKFVPDRMLIDRIADRSERAKLVSVVEGDRADILMAVIGNGDEMRASGIIVPQSVDGDFIEVELGDGTKLLCNLGGLSFSGGLIYRYDITVNSDYLWVNTTEQADWHSATVMENKPIGGITDPGEVSIGDFYMRDGSFMKKETKFTDAQKSACAGIVFWLGDPTSEEFGDPVLRREKPYCTHGLVVALHDAISATSFNQEEYEYFQAWQDSNLSGYEDINAEKNLKSNYGRILGYNNTAVLRQYDEQCEERCGVKMIAYLDAYSEEHAVPASKCSGWYLPSAKELSTLSAGWADDITHYSYRGTDNIKIVNESLELLGLATLTSGQYWSSTESGEHGVWFLDFTEGSLSVYNKMMSLGIRFVCAF